MHTHTHIYIYIYIYIYIILTTFLALMLTLNNFIFNSKHWHVLQVNPEVKERFQSSPIIASAKIKISNKL